jgi:hypothetical protein
MALPLDERLADQIEQRFYQAASVIELFNVGWRVI